MEPLHQQLEILDQIINQEREWTESGESRHTFKTAADYCQEYGTSDRTFKRHVADLKLYGADLHSEKGQDGAYVWRCRNWEKLLKTGIYFKWLQAERQRDIGIGFEGQPMERQP